ncbi:probable carboxy-terminal kinesin 2 [Rhynchosporium agropyri]|uniref:Probable carboxy-terminal kinesin 2 n=1 Tax=Rhynchosporium agropyri TaxID=914238 RepID=A0A1E1K4X2_9HELO|nr:probable carboxy-terminal kinesin 2 [Rhynchosporium agropyri]
MDYTEEENPYRPSQLKPPGSRIPSPPKMGLVEISESQGNARSKIMSRMPPPTSLKHKLGGAFNESEPKRKTLAERAGEVRPLVAPTPSSRPPVKGTTLVGAGKSMHSRNPSFTSSTSSRALSVSSRSTSNSSFSSSIGPNGRPKSSYGGRSQFSQSTATRGNTALPRPATSMDTHSSDDDLPPPGRRKGMEPPILIPTPIQSTDGYQTIRSKKLRAPHSMQSLRTQRSAANVRDVSVSTAMSRLRLDGEVKSKEQYEYQANSARMRPNQSLLSHKSSISSGLRGVRIDNTESALALFVPPEESVASKSPSHIPVLSKAEAPMEPPMRPTRTPKPSPQKTPYLTKDSNLPGFVAWDVDLRVERMEGMFLDMQNKITGTANEQSSLQTVLDLYKDRVTELDSLKTQLSSANEILKSDLHEMKLKVDSLQQNLLTAKASLDEQMRVHKFELDDAKRDHRSEMDQIKRDNTDEMDRILRKHRDETREIERRATVELEDKIRDLERRYNATLEEERSQRLREVQELETKITSGSVNLELELQRKDRDIQNMRGELESVKGDLDREQALKANAQDEISAMRETLQKTGVESASTIHTLESTVASLRARIHFLESGSKAQSDSFVEMERRLQEALDSAEESKRKLIKEESLRRILFNQVQELKGNIRVMCRVRPVFSNNADEGPVASLTYPDLDKESKELEIQGKEEKSSLGTISRKNHSFSFDRVFGPESQNQEVFEEISQLVQSALDGYNVCIFCYGQTGSGKTHTMSSADGMIPRATHQIYETATNLKDKGWTYTMEGSFVEVYNEEIHDLLGNSKDFEKKKHEVRHDEQRKQTTITGLKTVLLDSPNAVESILKQADNNRSVAATKSNERSSRSHSVFILKLVGRNSTTNETSEGTLNLVDLAGSERLKQSGAEGDRMKETQNINKSLSCLGDVIGALGSGKEGAHIPYRNSKLTYLLQYSLGGNSKTLMFVMASPLEAHLSETLTSLKFATKVHNTHIGTAKKSTKVRSSD